MKDKINQFKENINNKINTIKEYDFLIYGSLGLISGVVFLTTFEKASDLFTREALAAESLILSITFSAVLINTLLSSLFKKDKKSFQNTNILEEKKETYFATQQEPVKSFVPQNDLTTIAVAATAVAAIEYEWEAKEVPPVPAKAKEVESIPAPIKEEKTLADGVDILKEQMKNEQQPVDTVEEEEEIDYDEIEDNFEIDYAAGFVPEKNQSPFDA